MRHEQAEYVRRGATIGLVTVGNPEETSRFCEDRMLDGPFVCLSDPEKRAYGLYGLSRSNAKELLFSPHLYARGLQAALHGHFVGMPKGDPFQMPGVFIVDEGGWVRFAHRHRDAADNPSNTILLTTLDRIAEEAFQRLSATERKEH